MENAKGCVPSGERTSQRDINLRSVASRDGKVGRSVDYMDCPALKDADRKRPLMAMTHGRCQYPVRARWYPTVRTTISAASILYHDQRKQPAELSDLPTKQMRTRARTTLTLSAPRVLLFWKQCHLYCFFRMNPISARGTSLR